MMKTFLIFIFVNYLFNLKMKLKENLTKSLHNCKKKYKIKIKKLMNKLNI